jgi:hypothetical protein
MQARRVSSGHVFFWSTIGHQDERHQVAAPEWGGKRTFFAPRSDQGQQAGQYAQRKDRQPHVVGSCASRFTADVS